MALPISTEAERTLALRKIFEETPTELVLAWRKPTAREFSLFGRITHISSNVDFVLRYMAVIMDSQGMLEAPWAG